jgi:hypothetical protein
MILGANVYGGSSSVKLGKVPLPLDDYNARRLLIRLPTRIMPLLESPQFCADFLQRYFSRGGIFAFLALEGIYTLMTKHRL